MRTLNFYIALLVTVLFLGTGCKTIEKSIYNGDFDSAVNRLEKKITKGNSKKKDEYILLLENAYAKAQEEDILNITGLSKSANNWKSVLNTYNKLDNRQTKLKRFLPLYIKSENRNANFKLYDFKNEIVAYKKDVAEDLYKTAKNYLKGNNKILSRKANVILADINSFLPNYKDVSKLMMQSNIAGKSFILVNIDNRSGAFLPPALNNELTNFGLGDLNEKWIVYHTTENRNVVYDFNVDLVLNEVYVLPNFNDKKVIEQKKRVKDGWEYVLDRKGNVKKDSLGNDMKRDKFAWVTAKVGENLQQKQSRIAGNVFIKDLKNGQMVKNFPVSGNAIFENVYFDFIGDKRAISNELRNKIKNTSARPFPNEINMLLDANVLFRNAFKEGLDDNRRLVLN